MEVTLEKNIEVRLLGKPMVYQKGKTVSFPYQKVEALFYYLCIYKKISRSQAISVLWADCDQASARKNLRDAIYNIRKLLGQEVLCVEGNTNLLLNEEIGIQIDVDCVQKENLLECWKGEFLEFFYVKNCYEYEEWMEVQRGEILAKLMKLLSIKVIQFRPGDPWEILERSGRLLLKSKALEEELYRNIMRKLAEAGKYGKAQQLYNDFKLLLEKEIGTEPEEETVSLYEKISDMKKRINKAAKSAGDYFFGRTDILYCIYSKIRGNQGTRDRNASSFLLSGEAGIGKSMLMNQIKGVLAESEYLMFSWECCETEKELYLKPWYGIMEKVEEYCRNISLEVESPADVLFDQNMIESRFFMTRFEILTESVFRYLSKYFKDRKIILFFDDIQWMDDMSLKLLSNLLFRLGQSQMRVIAAVREEDQEEISNFKIPLIGRGILKEIPLQPFTYEEAGQIVKETDKRIGEDADLIEKIYGKTEGNPLFFMESLWMLKNREADLHFTDKLSYVIESRLWNLSKEEGLVLEALSMFSVSAPVQDINAILYRKEEDLRRDLRRLSDKKLILEKLINGEIHYAFRHQMIQEYVYSKVEEQKKMIYHNEIAHYYEKMYEKKKEIELCSILIYHFEGCGNKYKTYWYKAEYLEPFYKISYDYYPLLARKVKFCGEINGCLAREDGLVELAEELRREWKKDPKLSEIYMRVEYLRGRYEMFTSAFSQGLAHIQNSLSLAKEIGDRDYIFNNYLQMIQYGELTDRSDITKEYLEICGEFMEDCTQRHLEEECMLKRYQANYYRMQGRTEEAQKLLTEAVEKLEAAEKKEKACQIELAVCCHAQALCQILRENWKAAYACLKKAIHIGEAYLRSGEEGIFYSDMGIVLSHLEQYEEAGRYIEKAENSFREISSLWGAAKTQTVKAVWAFRQGRYEESEKSYREARRIAEKLNSTSLWEEIERTERLRRR